MINYAPRNKIDVLMRNFIRRRVKAQIILHITSSMQSSTSEFMLLMTPHPCHGCGKIGLHKYLMISNHEHKSIYRNPGSILTVTMDAPCTNHKPSEASRCEKCIRRRLTGRSEIAIGFFMSFCDGCAKRDLSRMPKNTINEYCCACPRHHDCPKCGYYNNECFEDIRGEEYQTVTVTCGECHTSYAPRDKVLF